MIERVRAILLTENAPPRILLLKRTRPGIDPYWVAPGGGVEPADASLEAALVRELFEELGATVDILKLVLLMDEPLSFEEGRPARQSVFLCHLLALDLTKRRGPEFDDPARGGYSPEYWIWQSDALRQINLVPETLKQFLIQHYADWGALPDLRHEKRASGEEE